MAYSVTNTQHASRAPGRPSQDTIVAQSPQIRAHWMGHMTAKPWIVKQDMMVAHSAALRRALMR